MPVRHCLAVQATEAIFRVPEETVKLPRARSPPRASHLQVLFAAFFVVLVFVVDLDPELALVRLHVHRERIRPDFLAQRAEHFAQALVVLLVALEFFLRELRALGRLFEDLKNRQLVVEVRPRDAARRDLSILVVVA